MSFGGYFGDYLLPTLYAEEEVEVTKEGRGELRVPIWSLSIPPMPYVFFHHSWRVEGEIKANFTNGELWL